MDALNTIITFFQDIYNIFNSKEYLRAVWEGTEAIGSNLHILGGQTVAAIVGFCKPMFKPVADWHHAYSEAEEAFFSELFEELFMIFGKVKVDIADFNYNYLIGFTVDDFRFFKHHWDEPGGVNTQGGYEDVVLLISNAGFHIVNFIEYYILPFWVDFGVDYQVSAEHLVYGGVFAMGFAALGLLYDYSKTLIDVQFHMHRMESMHIAAVTEYLYKHKILYKNKKLQDSFEDRQYNAGGFDRELFISIMMYDPGVQDKLRKYFKVLDEAATADAALNTMNNDLGGIKKNPNKKLEEEKDPEDIVVDYTIDPVKIKIKTQNTTRFSKGTKFSKEIIRRWYLAESINLFQIFDSPVMKFGMCVSFLYDLPRNLFKLCTLFGWGFKTLVAVSGPTNGTHFDVDFKIYLDLFTIHQGEDTARVQFHKFLLNYLYDFYVEFFNDNTIDADGIVNRYVESKLKHSGGYYKYSVARTMKYETLFFFGLRMQLFLDLLEFRGPFLVFIRNWDIMLINFVRFILLYFLRIWGRFLKMPLIESIDEILVRYQLKRVVSPLEEASCFDYVPSYARNDVIGYIKYLDDNNIKHLFHVAYYKGGKKKTHGMGLQDLFWQFFQIDVLFGKNFIYAKGIQPFGVHKYDIAFKYTLRGSFYTYIGARLYIPFIFFVRKRIFQPINQRIKRFFKKTGTGEMYIFVTFLRFGYDTPFYKVWSGVYDCGTVGYSNMKYRTVLPAEHKANHAYTREMSLRNMADKNKNGFLFHMPYFYYNAEYMFQHLYYGFEEEDEQIYTHEEDGLETDYKEDHDSLLESDFQLRKNWFRDMNAGYALINEESGIGTKQDMVYDFYSDSEQIYGTNIRQGSIFISSAARIQNSSKPVRQAFNKQKVSYKPHRAYEPYRQDFHLNNGERAYNENYQAEIDVMEKEALYLLYYHVNSPLNGFFTPCTEIDNGSYYSHNTLFQDSDEPLNEEEYILYDYTARFAYGPYGRYLDELPALLGHPDAHLVRIAKKKGHISKKGRQRLGKGDYYKSLQIPLDYSVAATTLMRGVGVYEFMQQFKNDAPGDQKNESEAINEVLSQKDYIQDVNKKVRERFEIFLSEHKELQDEFNTLLRDSYTTNQMNNLKYAEHLFIGTDSYISVLKTAKEKDDLLKKYFGILQDKLKDN